MFPNTNCSSGSHFVSVSTYNRLRTWRSQSRGSSDSEAIQSGLQIDPHIRALTKPLMLADQVAHLVDDAYIFKQLCIELKPKAEKLAALLRHAAGLDLYERPTRRIMDDTEYILRKALALVSKCSNKGVLKRILTIIRLAAFEEVSAHLDNAVEDVSWLLRICAGGDDMFGLPPVAQNDPILFWIWGQIALLHTGDHEARVDAAECLVSLARDNERYRQLIIEEDGVGPLLRLAKNGQTEEQKHAAKAIELLGLDLEQMVVAGVCSISHQSPAIHPTIHSSRSHFVSLSHYNRLRTYRSRESSDSFSSDFETIQSSPNPPQVPTQTYLLSSSGNSPSRLNLLAEPPFLYPFDEISYAIHDLLAERLSSSSWLCTLRDESVVVFCRTFNGELTDSRLAVISRSHHHCSLVRLFGVSLHGDRIFVVYQYFAGSVSLKECLSSVSFSDWTFRMQVALDVAKGLEYIHRDCDMVHGKIRSWDIIVMEPSFNAKIGLFGARDLATSDDDDVDIRTERLDGEWLRIEEGTGYIAPEVLDGARMSKQSDVFAFGVLILELVSGNVPLEYRMNKETLECERMSVIETAKNAIESDNDGRRGRISLWVDRKLQDSLPVGAAEELIRLGLQCVEVDPSMRPEMMLVAATISKLFMDQQ